MDTKKPVVQGGRQTRLEFVLSWIVAIVLVILGQRIGGTIGFLLALPIGVSTALAVAAVLSRNWPALTKGGIVVLIYSVAGIALWAALWVAIPAIRGTSGVA